MGQFDQRRHEHDAAADVATGVAPGKASKSQKPYGAPPDSFPQPVSVKVTASALRVRSAPNTSSPENIVGRLKRGQMATAVGRDGNWLRIEHDGQVAFIHGQYVRVNAGPSAATRDADADVGAAKPAAGASPTTSFVDNASEAGSSIVEQLEAVFFWLHDVVEHACDEEHDKPDVPGGHKTDPDKPAPAPEVHEDEVKQAPEEPVTPRPPVVVPAGAASLRDPELAAFLAAQNNAAVNMVAHQLADAEQAFDDIKQSQNEEIGKDRDKHVAQLGMIRQGIGALDKAGLDPTVLPQVKAKLYRAVQDLAPYYSQGRNVNVLEGESTRTCNITSLAMALESLGVSAGAYKGGHEKVLAAANYSVYRDRIRSEAKHTTGGTGGDWGQMIGLRLPDFLQFVAIADCAGGTSDSAVLAGAQAAWNKILSIYFLSELASKFGVGGSVKTFTTDTGAKKQGYDALSNFGGAHRKDVEHLVDARNKYEASGAEKDKAAYEKLLAREQKAMDGDGKLDIADYRNAIISQVGADLDSGAAIVVSISGHYVRLQAIHDDHVVVDDPGRTERSNRKVTWEEARAMGYFKHRLVLR